MDDLKERILDIVVMQKKYKDKNYSARKLAPVTDTMPTFNGYGKCEPSLIDHVFVRGFKVKEFHTLNGDYGVPYISDHYPIKIIVES